MNDARLFQLSVETAATCYALTQEVHRLAELIDPNYTPEAIGARLRDAQIHYTEQLHLAIGDKAPEVAEELMRIAARWRAAGE